MYTVVVVRHGQSEWNLQNLFTGWTDVRMTEKGREEAREAGQKLQQAGYQFDVAYTSLLSRAIETLNLALAEMDLHWIPVYKSWRLNERHYGALQGLDKKETAEREGKEQVHLWRRSYEVEPPALSREDERFPGHDPRYQDLDPSVLPTTENLKMTVERVLPYWQDIIAKSITQGQRVLISAHGNSLRALVKHLEKMSDEDIPHVEIPTGQPLVYKLDENFVVQNKFYL
jgi:2,3-bisphosphoglycerate-dependent phosphoglycerate mutase